MKRSTVWATTALLLVVSESVLAYVAVFRFASALMYPAPPEPDYTVKAAVALGAAALVLAVGLGMGWFADRNAQARRRILGWSVGIVIALTAVGSTFAMFFSAPSPVA